MSQIQVFDGYYPFTMENMIENENLLTENPVQPQSLKIPIQLYVDKGLIRKHYAYDAEMVLSFWGSYSGQYFKTIDDLVHGVRNFVTEHPHQEFRPADFPLSPIFWTGSDKAYSFPLRESLVGLVWTALAPWEIKRKAYGLMLGTIRGLNEEERREFETKWA